MMVQLGLNQLKLENFGQVRLSFLQFGFFIIILIFKNPEIKNIAKNHKYFILKYPMEF